MGHQQLYWSHLQKFGKGSHSDHICSNQDGLIQKYSLNICSQCLYRYVKDIGSITLD
ncbi:small ribosomal subunit protein uS14-like [Equus przewalskii]|uniref:Small ribosomal subunit protein uS14-like n=1 Tax=Equus przewalskii TaxID=9798 RepID=A0ABM4P5J1_EQUPR